MSQFTHNKYPTFAFAPELPNRQWPNRVMSKAPVWASVDLRDGNQALIDPMTIKQKLRFFELLVDCGFKEIEIGFPSASQIEFDFTRLLIEEGHIPDDVTIQVLVQAREHLIERTFEALKGVRRAIVHVYNSTSKVQREKVFAKSQEEITEIAINGAQMVKDHAAKHPDSEWVFQYSPESFSQTEPEYAVAVVDTVCEVWRPQDGQQVIINLPATVESSMPNIFADQVEYFCTHLGCREHVVVSVHTHNDRGCAVAASELAVLAGADRVEGTLLGNGERTGNMDIMVMAMNLYSTGIDPELDFAKMNEIVHVVSECNNLPVHPRHPYIGELVFTAFSGSHQDAIKKSLDRGEAVQWEVAYLPIDPLDIGRSYQDVVRINSQSGKGGVAYILARDHGLNLPRWLQVDFAQKVQKESERTQKELSSQDIIALFEAQYLPDGDLQLADYSIRRQAKQDSMNAVLTQEGRRIEIGGSGSGVLSSFIDGLQKETGLEISVTNYAEHAMTQSTDSQAVAYVQLIINGALYTGIAYSSDTVTAMLRATLVGVSLALEDQAKAA
ncbi:2-isopropylmalate synthase [Suttonella sp. R2A3]|uniref:2-isopropylmalate synthase n=1 Tax=Suttonella sp. R2A3 TaxID=2908648 RepID=UPI001F46E350|nr:2-isopropylmalate synthase [Suttonella sp. R2A3]UJF25250.1 2-isopropylmalate synthase [Suttonella sp. R2A3]